MKRWEDLGGKPQELNNRWKLTITDDNNPDAPFSVYRGTKAEIAEQLAASQENANRRIDELRSAKPNGAAHAPAPLTPADRMQIVADLDNPATVDSAIKRVVEAQTGVTMEDERAARELDRQTNAAMQWAQNNPEWFDSEFNKRTLVNYIRSQGGDLANPAHYQQAFESLSAAQLLQTAPAGAPEEVEPEENETSGQRNAPVPVPVAQVPSRRSTGVMSRDISGLPPRPTTRLKWTREQINDMSAADYKQAMLTDSEFSKCVEYYAQLDRQQQRRRMA